MLARWSTAFRNDPAWWWKQEEAQMLVIHIPQGSQGQDALPGDLLSAPVTSAVPQGRDSFIHTLTQQTLSEPMAMSCARQSTGEAHPVPPSFLVLYSSP